YALGTVLYEALTGLVPHLGRNAIETIDMQIHKDPMSFASKRPDIYIPERLESVVLKALAKDPAARQQSMKELALELEAAVPRKNEALNLRAKIEPAKDSLSKKSLNPAIVIGGFVIVSLIVGLAVKHSIDSSPSNTVPLRPTSTTPVSTQTSTPTPSPATTQVTTPAATPATTVAPSANADAQPTTPQSTKASPDHSPPGSKLHAPNESTQPSTVHSASQVKQVQSPRHKIEPPKLKPAAAKVAKPKRDPWARIESRMKKTAPKSDQSSKTTNAKAPSRWSHMEQQLPVSP
ncbi:MAG: hypothetical protein HYX67_07420, partial [Candidatus Melainabacteria bacterium]|nr:hypothetical protein [Candidatus Melainabacteria bacterium]